MTTEITSRCLVEWVNQSLELLPQRALWWPANSTLFIADLHLGKAASFRQLGQPVPSGSTQENLNKLDELIDCFKPQHLICLGDFLHAKTGRTESVLQALRNWRKLHSELKITLVRGNHDSHAGDPPAELNIYVVEEPWLVGPFAACHHPQTHATHLVLCGHNHPVVNLYGVGRDRLRLPCFIKDSRKVVLPAFGEFTGGHPVELKPGTRIYVVGGDKVWRLPDLS